jgi:hypothetical protein
LAGLGPLFYLRFIIIAGLFQRLIAFARNSFVHETTNAPYGAFFNAYAFAKVGTMVCAQAIQEVIFFVEDSDLHRLQPPSALP